MTKNDLRTAKIEFRKEELKNQMKEMIIDLARTDDGETKNQLLKDIFKNLDDCYDFMGLVAEVIVSKNDVMSELIECMD